MGKINSLFLRKSRGKLAGTTLYTTSGVTIQRELPGTIKNPRTKRQMTQRCKLANLVNMYKAGKTFFASAFENKKPLVSDYNMFVGKNLAANPVMLPKDIAATGKFFAAPYQITSGTLHASVTNIEAGDLVTCNLALGEFTSISANTTIAALSTALLNNNSWLRPGDQLSFVLVSGISVVEQVSIVSTYFKAYELLLDTDSQEKVVDFIPGLKVNEDVLAVSISPDFQAGAFVVSRTVAGKTYVTSEVLTGIEVDDTDWYTDAWKQHAIDSYGESKEVFLDSEEAHKA